MNNHRNPIHVKTQAAALAIVTAHKESAWFHIEDERATKYVPFPGTKPAPTKPTRLDFIEIYGSAP